MPELPEVETTVRGLAQRARRAGGSTRVEPRRADLRRAFPHDLGQRLTGARVTGLGAARQIWADPHRPRRHAGVPPRHVGALADRSGRDRQARPSGARDRRRAGGSRSTIRGGSARSIWCRPTSSTTGRRSPRSGPSRSASTDRGAAEAAARRAQARRSSCCCSTSGSSRGSATSMSARRCSARGSTRGSAAGEVCARAARAAGAGDPRGARRGDRGGRLDACAILPRPTASSAISPSSFEVYGREGEPCRVRRHGPADRPGRALDLLLPAMPALS